MYRLKLVQLKTHSIGPIDLELAPAECVGLYGPSGSGKTLLLRAIADLDPHSGDVLLDDQSCWLVPPPEWRHN